MTLAQVPSTPWQWTLSRCAPFLLALLGLALSGAAAGAENAVRIGVIRSADIPVFQRVQKGFADGLASSGYREGENLVFDIQNTKGEPKQAQVIARKFAAEKVALIHSIGTAPTLAVIQDASTPVVFSAVTDPVSAGIFPAGSLPGSRSGNHVTGVTDAWPVHLQLEIFARIVPNAQRWGTIYNPAEPNSVHFVQIIRDSAKRLGLELVEATVSESSEVRAAALGLAGKNVTAIFNPADSTVSSGFKDLVDACNQNKIALFTGGNGVARGALASYGIDYYLVGYAAGKKASLVLKGIRAGAIAWGTMDKFSLVINLTAASAQGVTVPPEMLRMADRVIE